MSLLCAFTFFLNFQSSFFLYNGIVWVDLQLLFSTSAGVSYFYQIKSPSIFFLYIPDSLTPKTTPWVLSVPSFSLHVVHSFTCLSSCTWCPTTPLSKHDENNQDYIDHGMFSCRLQFFSPSNYLIYFLKLKVIFYSMVFCLLGERTGVLKLGTLLVENLHIALKMHILPV